MSASTNRCVTADRRARAARTILPLFTEEQGSSANSPEAWRIESPESAGQNKVSVGTSLKKKKQLLFQYLYNLNNFSPVHKPVNKLKYEMFLSGLTPDASIISSGVVGMPHMLHSVYFLVYIEAASHNPAHAHHHLQVNYVTSIASHNKDAEPISEL